MRFIAQITNYNIITDLHARVRVSVFVSVCYGHVQHKQLTIACFACVLKHEEH